MYEVLVHLISLFHWISRISDGMPFATRSAKSDQHFNAAKKISSAISAAQRIQSNPVTGARGISVDGVIKLRSAKYLLCQCWSI